MKPIIAPSILSANFSHLQKDIEMLNESEAEWIHIDVMDGVFVPNISFGFPILKAVKKHTKKICDVHLMITQPENYIQQFCDAGANHISIHYEGNYHLDSTIQKIKAGGATAGVALNPSTPVTVLHTILPMLDTVLIMSVNPGFGGQTFIEYTYGKIRELKLIIDQLKLNTRIQVDGGVNLLNSPKLIAAGTGNLVAGNAVFMAENPKDVIATMRANF